MKILITGGAGFIGSNIISHLEKMDVDITVIDNLSPQIHGHNPEITSSTFIKIKDKVNFINGDILDCYLLDKTVIDKDVIIHLASETGTGQSMYEIKKYSDVNIIGTANLLESIAKSKKTLKKLVLSSSRAVYGEGKYYCEQHGIVYPTSRSKEDLLKGQFECKCPICNQIVTVKPTDESSNLNPGSIYGVTKQVQEQYIRQFCEGYEIPYSILRYQNVYGPGQSLNNPYTGILSIFSSLILENKNINVFEDGKESRDFVFIDDVARITTEVAITHKGDFKTINVGTGKRITVLEIVLSMLNVYNSNAQHKISGDFRLGDIRHNFADASFLNKIGLQADIKFEDGLKQFSSWVLSTNRMPNNYLVSLNELAEKGILLNAKK
jgi:dTDP-L-rhamnose 4-epimerase